MAMSTRRAPEASADPALVLTKALGRAFKILGLNQRELARVLGVSESTTSRMLAGCTLLDPESKEGELGLLLLRTFRSLHALVGGDAATMKLWMRAENQHLGGVPAERIQQVEGLVRLVDYLDAMRGKL